MTRPAKVRSRAGADVTPFAPVGSDVGLVTPADRFARNPPSPRVERTGAVDRDSDPDEAASLWSYLRALFDDGGSTVWMRADAEPDRLYASTLIQLDGDLVVSLDPNVDPADVGYWRQHVADVACWFDGLRTRLDRVVRRLEGGRLLVLASLPLVASIVAVASAGRSAADARYAGAAGVIAGAVAVAEMANSLFRSTDAVDIARRSESARWLTAIREHRWYNVAVAIAPAIVGGVAGVLQWNWWVIALAIVVPLVALAATGIAFLWARKRLLGAAVG